MTSNDRSEQATFSFLVTSDGDPMQRLFAERSNGRVAFGYSAESVAASRPEEVFTRGIAMRDYLMERRVVYLVQAERHDLALKLSITCDDPRQFGYLTSAIQHYIRSCGCDAQPC